MSFSKCQNILFNTPINAAFMIGSMQADPTYTRLLEAAEELKGLKSPADIARGLGVLDQHLTNWKSRGIPKSSVMDIAEWLGCNPYWLRDGKGQMRGVVYGLSRQQTAVVTAMQKMPEDNQDQMVKISYTYVEPEDNGGNGGNDHPEKKQAQQ